MSQQPESQSDYPASPRAPKPIGARAAEARAFSAWREPEGDGPEPARPLEAFAIDAAILAVAAGDRAHFAELFQKLAPRAKAYLIHRGLAPAVAEDLAIEAMIEVWRTARSFDPSTSRGQTWIFQRLRDVTHRHGLTLQAAGP